MPFKTTRNSNPSADSPEALFLDLRTRGVPGLLAHQAGVLRECVEEALSDSDAAFQLLTGSGKTREGLPLGEWRRRKYEERVVYYLELVRRGVAVRSARTVHRHEVPDHLIERPASQRQQ